MFDFELSGDFNATEVLVTALSASARGLLSSMFGTGAASFILPKSRLDEFICYAAEHGCKCG